MLKYLIPILFIFNFVALFGSVENESVLKELDTKLEESYLYRIDKERSINSLKFSLANATNTAEEFALCQNIFEQYNNYQYDSAYVYALRTESIALAMSNNDYLAQAYTNLLFCYTTVGLFLEGGVVIEKFRPQGVSEVYLANFYVGCVHYYQNLQLYVKGIAKDLSVMYREKQMYYIRKALSLIPEDSFKYNFTKVQNDVFLGYDNLSTSHRLRQLLSTPQLSEHKKAIIYAWLGKVYEEMGARERAIYYVALSAISDIESCTFETTSAKELAGYMYEAGEINRASLYIRHALNDANTYNSLFRKMEIQVLLPEIEKQRYDTIQKDKGIMIVIICLFVVLLAIIITMFVKIRRRNMSLRATRKELEQRAMAQAEVNELLQNANEELADSNKIKDQYIIQSLYGDSGFVDKVESICKQMKQKIKVKQYDDLGGMIYKLDIKQERNRMSSAFDSAFLKLFPNFVDEYNKLFDSENAIRLDDNNSLQPEVRIFALIRLGIEDVNLISKYLNLSTNTIYVYRAKVKSKTIVPKEEFEDYIKRIV